jgi:arginase
MRPIGLLGVPTNSAGTTDGVSRAPAALREAGLVDALRQDVDVHDYGDVILADPTPARDPTTHLIDPRGLATMVGRARDAVASILGDGRFPLVIGGDCPLLLGCLIAVRDHDRIGLLFVDGHEDAYLPEQSSTGEAADTELAFALGMADASWSSELAAELPIVAPADVRILGARDRALLRAEGVASLGDRLVLVDGDRLVADPAGETVAASSSLTHPWWFHLDLDVLSTEALPAVDYPQPGGLGWNDLSLVATTALAAGPAGWDVTIYNPDLDPERIHARRIAGFVRSAIAGGSGRSRLPHPRPSRSPGTET